MQTDREKAIHYVRKALNPGDTFTAKDLGHFIGRAKSETLRVIDWLKETGYIMKQGSGPSTCYKTVPPLNIPRDIKIIESEEGTSFVRTDEKPDVEESIHAIPENVVPSISKAYIAQKNQELLEKSRETLDSVELNQMRRFINPPYDVAASEEAIKKGLAKRTAKLYRLEEAIESKLMATQDRLQFLKIAYAKEPIFRNDYLLQFLYGQLEILEELKGMD